MRVCKALNQPSPQSLIKQNNWTFLYPICAGFCFSSWTHSKPALSSFHSWQNWTKTHFRRCLELFFFHSIPCHRMFDHLKTESRQIILFALTMNLFRVRPKHFLSHHLHLRISLFFSPSRHHSPSNLFHVCDYAIRLLSVNSNSFLFLCFPPNRLDAFLFNFDDVRLVWNVLFYFSVFYYKNP